MTSACAANDNFGRGVAHLPIAHEPALTSCWHRRGHRSHPDPWPGRAEIDYEDGFCIRTATRGAMTLRTTGSTDERHRHRDSDDACPGIRHGPISTFPALASLAAADPEGSVGVGPRRACLERAPNSPDIHDAEPRARRHHVANGRPTFVVFADWQRGSEWTPTGGGASDLDGTGVSDSPPENYTSGRRATHLAAR